MRSDRGVGEVVDPIDLIALTKRELSRISFRRRNLPLPWIVSPAVSPNRRRCLLVSHEDGRRQTDREPLPAKAGIGLRFPHHAAVLETRPDIAWLEVHTENYMGGGQPIAHLEAIRAHYLISLHGVGLSLGSAEELDASHLERIQRTAERIEPALVSEHLSWSVVDGRYLADLPAIADD